MRIRQKCIVTPGEPQGVIQYHWTTGAKEKYQLTPNDHATDKNKSSTTQLK